MRRRSGTHRGGDANNNPFMLRRWSLADDERPTDEPLGLSCSQKLRWSMATSQWGTIMEVINLVLSGLVAAFYVAETYVGRCDSSACTSHGRFLGFVAFEVLAVSYFSLYFLLGLIASQRKWAFIFRRDFMIVDVCSIAPIAVLTLSSDTLVADANPPYTRDVWISLIRLLVVARVLYIFHMHRMFQSEITRQMFFLAFNALSLTFIIAAGVHVFENIPELLNENDLKEFEPLPFYDSYYMMFTTITTIGYGDLTPKTPLGRVLIVILMGIALLTIPRRTNRLVSLLAQQSVYVHTSFRASADSSHIILCGSVGDTATGTFGAGSGAVSFFLEFFHEDHGAVDSHAVVLGTGRPTRELEGLLGDKKYAVGITFLQGDVFQEKDMKRASTELAKAVFVLCNRFASDPDTEDARTILRALSLKRYVFQRTGSDIQTVVQLIRPENKRVFLSTAASYTRTMQAAVKGGSAVVGRRRSSLLRGSSDNGTTNLVVCLEELRSNLLSLSCLCPGLCTLVYNLVASVSGADEVKDRKRAWLQEYHSGMEYEIYRVPLSVHFEGVTFLQAAEIVYSEVGCILFALEVKVPGMESRVLLNPGSWELPDPLIYHLHGFVIAEDKKQADAVSFMTSKHPRRKRAKTGPKAGGIGGLAAEVLERQALRRARVESNAAGAAGDAGGGGGSGGGNGGTTPQAKGRPTWKEIVKRTMEARINIQSQPDDDSAGPTEGDASEGRGSFAGSGPPSPSGRGARNSDADAIASNNNSVGPKPTPKRRGTFLGKMKSFFGTAGAGKGKDATSQAMMAKIEAAKAQQGEGGPSTPRAGGSAAGSDGEGSGFGYGGSPPLLAAASPPAPSALSLNASFVRSPSGGGDSPQAHASRNSGSGLGGPLASPSGPSPVLSLQDAAMIAQEELNSARELPAAPELLLQAGMAVEGGWIPGGPACVLHDATILSVYDPHIEEVRKKADWRIMRSWTEGPVRAPSTIEAPSSDAESVAEYEMERDRHHSSTRSLGAEISGIPPRHPTLGELRTRISSKSTKSMLYMSARRLKKVPVLPTNDEGEESSPRTEQEDRNDTEARTRLRMHFLKMSTAMYSKPLIRDHVIVCFSGKATGTEVEDAAVFDSLPMFIQPLRAAHVGRRPPVVIVHPCPPSDEAWAKLSLYGDVWYCKGSPLASQDLLRAGVKEARSMVIIASFTSLTNDPGVYGANDPVVDANSVVMYTLGRAANPSLNIIVELSNQANVTLLSTDVVNNDELSAPDYAAGFVLNSAIPDVLACQAYYNPHIINVVQRLLVAYSPESQRNWAERTRKELGEVQESFMHLVKVPEALHGATFGELFSHFSGVYQALPLGLRRATTAMSIAESGRISAEPSRGGDGAVTPVEDKAESRSSATGGLGLGIIQEESAASPQGTTPRVSGVSARGNAQEAKNGQEAGPLPGAVESVHHNHSESEKDRLLPRLSAQSPDRHRAMSTGHAAEAGRKAKPSTPTSPQSMGNALPYVFTNPPPSTVLHPGDAVFCLIPNIPRGLEVSTL